MKISLYSRFLLIAALPASMATQRLRVSKDAEDEAMAYTSPSSSVEWSTSTFSASVDTLPWHHRTLLSISSRLCYAGLPAPCMCTEDKVRSAIEGATTGKLLLPRLRICSGTYIDITSAINITGKTFRLGCFPIPLPGVCGLDGGRKNQLLVGAPDDVTIFGISFDRGRAGNNTDGNGGAIKITGGKLTLKESQFFDHLAESGNGGGLYATGNTTKVSISSSRFEGNRAVNGAAFYFTNGAELSVKRTAFLYNNASKSGGAMGFFDAKATLTANTIAGNVAKVSGNDIFVGGTSARDSTGFITCKKRAVDIFPNLFCDGPGGIADAGSGNTNCADEVDSSGSRCNLA